MYALLLLANSPAIFSAEDVAIDFKCVPGGLVNLVLTSPEADTNGFQWPRESIQATLDDVECKQNVGWASSTGVLSAGWSQCIDVLTSTATPQVTVTIRCPQTFSFLENYFAHGGWGDPSLSSDTTVYLKGVPTETCVSVTGEVEYSQCHDALRRGFPDFVKSGLKVREEHIPLPTWQTFATALLTDTTTCTWYRWSGAPGQTTLRTLPTSWDVFGAFAKRAGTCPVHVRRDVTSVDVSTFVRQSWVTLTSKH